MSTKEDDFWLDDPEWAALREKQKLGKSKGKLTRSQRKKLREAQFQAELKAQQAQKNAPSPQAQGYMGADRPSARYVGARPASVITPTVEQTPPRVNSSASPSSSGDKNVNVSLNLTLPHIEFAKVKRITKTKLAQITPKPIKQQLKKRTRKQLFIGAATMSLLVIGLIGLLVVTGPKGADKGGDKGVLAAQTIKLDFKPLLPDGKKDETTAQKAAKDGQGRPIYTFIDKIGSIDVTVSEQPLPEAFKANPDSELEKMAKDLYLTDVIHQSNPKAYLGTSVKGPQTVIFTKNGLLVFIQSQGKVDKDQWSDYVTRLVP